MLKQGKLTGDIVNGLREVLGWGLDFKRCAFHAIGLMVSTFKVSFTFELSTTCVLFKVLFDGFYHGKSPLNHLGNMFFQPLSARVIKTKVVVCYPGVIGITHSPSPTCCLSLPSLAPCILKWFLKFPTGLFGVNLTQDVLKVDVHVLMYSLKYHIYLIFFVNSYLAILLMEEILHQLMYQ